MKFIWLLPILFVACQKSNFTVGECIQRPDEIFRYQIVSLNEDKARLKPLNGGSREVATLSGSMWTLTNCK